jgi:restriction system protein
MAVPDFQTLMRPILVQLQDGQPRAIGDVRAALVSEFSLTGEDLAEELPSGRAKTLQPRGLGDNPPLPHRSSHAAATGRVRDL